MATNISAEDSAHEPSTDHAGPAIQNSNSLGNAQLEQEVKRRQPWKYIGYKVFSHWIASSDEFFHIRRFDALNARVVLFLQDEISQLEEELENLDDPSKQQNLVNNGSFRKDPLEDRKRLIGDILKKLEQYNAYIVNYSALRLRPPVPKDQVRNTENWFYNNGPNPWVANSGAIADEEQAYIQETDDLMTIAPKFKSPLWRFIEENLKTRYSYFQRVPSDKVGYDPKIISHRNNSRTEEVLAAVVITVGLVMIIAPLWILEFVTGSVQRLGIITAFIVLFLVIVASICASKPFETLAGTAGYSAVLMVFLLIGTPPPT